MYRFRKQNWTTKHCHKDEGQVYDSELKGLSEGLPGIKKLLLRLFKAEQDPMYSDLSHYTWGLAQSCDPQMDAPHKVAVL